MLSTRLSSQAKREVLLSPPDKIISVMLTVSPQAAREELTDTIERAGGEVLSWSDTTNIVNAALPVGALESISDCEGISFVETGGRYRAN